MKTNHLTQTVGFLALSATAALLPGSVFGLGIALPDQDAFATARGNAFVATANDPAAIFYNPAGISQLDGMNTSIGAYGIVYGSTFKGGGQSLDSKTQFAVLPQVFSTYSIPKYHLTLGLGTYSPYGLRYEWPAFTPLIGEETGQITYITINPVVAYQICSTLSVAAGPTLNYSEAELRETPTLPPPFPPLNFINYFRGHDVDVGYNAGILWHPLEQHSIGVTYRSATDMNYSGHATAFPPGGPNNSATANFHFPQTVDFGYSFRPTKDWNLEADAVWTDWETLKTVALNPNAATNPYDAPTFNWKSSWMFDLGVTRYLGEGWRVSGGYMYSMNSVPSANFNPLVPDSDRHIFSVGVGKRYKKFSWDAAYQLAWGPSRSVSGSSFPGADGNYDFLSNALTINFGYHF